METLDIRQVQTKLGLIAQVTDTVDLEGFLAELDLADAVGPVLFPSEWIAGEAGLRDWREMAKALLEFQRVSRPHLEEARERRRQVEAHVEEAIAKAGAP